MPNFSRPIGRLPTASPQRNVGAGGASSGGPIPLSRNVMDRAQEIRAARRESHIHPENAPMTKAEKRAAKMARFHPSSEETISRAHEGVVTRPMDRQLSHDLERRRAEMLQRGTSVRRLKKQYEKEEEAEAAKRQEDVAAEALSDRENILKGEEIEELGDVNSREDVANRATSVGRLANPIANLRLRNPRAARPDTTEPPDMII